MHFQEGSTIVMIGDSITDCGRREDPEGLGNGYVRMIHDYAGLHYPELEWTWFNRGVGGNRVTDLQERWEQDVLALQPNWVSISIGINDVWRQLNPERLHEAVYLDTYEAVYRDLLERTTKETNASLILMETTVIEEDLQSKGNALLQPYNEAIHQLAEAFSATIVPMNRAFHDYLKHSNRLTLTTDGVHMTSAGNTLMAMTWIKTLMG